MATVTITSTCSTNLTQAITFENNRADLREPSFSSYLNSSEETFVLRLTESTWKPSNTISVTQEPVCSVNAGRKKTEDGEYSIFGAEKYFNGAMDEEKTKAAENGRRMNQNKKVQVKSKYGTPSTCSELSSNSQNALLAGFSTTPNRHYRQNSRRFFSTFSCKCPCSNKKSVDIGKNVAESKPTSINKKHFDCAKIHSSIKAQEIPAGYIRTHEPWFKEEIPSKRFENLSLKSADREEYVSFPKSKSAMENIAVEEKARNALELEVFGSPVLDQGDIGLNLQNKLTALNWDANPRSDDLATSISIEIEDDARSDSSSDLFEIKTISDSSHPFFRSQETDGMSSCASPSSCYEPSEASIEWSVVTASVANMSVAASEFGDHRSTNVTYTEKSGTNKEVPRRRSSTLLGCRSHKAVKVVAEAHKMKPEKVKSDPQRHHRSDSFKQLTRFQAETKVKDFESARVQRASATRSQPATVPHTLYMN